MSGSQGSRGLALLRRFSRFAVDSSSSCSASASTVGQAAGRAPVWFLPFQSSQAAGSSTGAFSTVIREARAMMLRSTFSTAASAPGRAQGMLMSGGVLSRGAAAPSAAVSGWRAVAGLAGSRLVRPATARLCSSGTAAAAAEAAPRALYGGAALSAGLSSGARLALAGWLAVCAAWVYSMVVLGGITRLTRSGLSMTEWKLAGERPPMSEAEWEAEFVKYKASPEYLKVHRGMTLEEFKFIYWMEYAHRMWGRFLGLAFALPAAFFAARGWVGRPLARRLGLLFFMGGTQGLVGWWMVRSGLEEPEHEWAAPRVSPYRLAAHLVSAFAIYATLVWTSLDLLYPRPATSGAPESLLRSTAGARRVLLPLAALIAVTATSGAFVAGMDAGRAYNTWPLMGDEFFPEEYWDERLGLTPLRNMFENTAAVQFNHRTLATLTLLAVGASWLRYRGGALPGRATTCLHALAGVTAAQFALGVYTLLQYVPVPLGSAHQANALNLFTAALALLHACRPPLPAGGGALAPLVTPAAVLAVGGIGWTVASANGTVTQSGRYTGPTGNRA